MAKKHEFKTESKRLLDLMINSIYTHKEIFLRELISNASDAIDKYHYKSLTEKDFPSREYSILIECDKEARQITITDTGIGMNEEDLINNLGTIARSGSLEFQEKMKEAKAQQEVDIIGQFGVGFYSAFMLAKEVSVETKALNSKALKWVSTGESDFEISDSDKEDIGTKIVLTLRDNEEEDSDSYDEYLSEWKIKELVKKYSDYVRYPVQMMITKSIPKLDDKGKEIEGESDSYEELETLNSMIPIWKRSKKDVTDEELCDFYKYQYNDNEDPLKVIRINVEGLLTYQALLFIPKKAQYDLYSSTYKKGLQLYSKGVFIMDKSEALLPDYLRFVKGLVDSSDLTLNISREVLQHDKQLAKIAQNVEKKVLKELEKMLKNDREAYLEFFTEFGLNIKYGVYESYGMKKDSLQDLLVYKTSTNDEYQSLKDYTKRMSKEQTQIYYASGKNKEQILAVPQMDAIKNKGYEVLLLTDDVDEFAIQMLQEYDKHKFCSIQKSDLDLASDEEKEQFKKITDEKKDLISSLKDALVDSVDDVILSTRLTDSPVCLVSGEGLSFEMERVLSQMPNGQDAKAKKILEINPNHSIFNALEKVYSANAKDISKYANLLYSQALLIEGLAIENPVEFSNLMCELIVKSAN